MARFVFARSRIWRLPGRALTGCPACGGKLGFSRVPLPERRQFVGSKLAFGLTRQRSLRYSKQAQELLAHSRRLPGAIRPRLPSHLHLSQAAMPSAFRFGVGAILLCADDPEICAIQNCIDARLSLVKREPASGPRASWMPVLATFSSCSPSPMAGIFYRRPPQGFRPPNRAATVTRLPSASAKPFKAPGRACQRSMAPAWNAATSSGNKLTPVTVIS